MRRHILAAVEARLRERLGIPPGAIVAAFVATLDRAHHFKRLDVAIEALADLEAYWVDEITELYDVRSGLRVAPGRLTQDVRDLIHGEHLLVQRNPPFKRSDLRQIAIRAE